MENDLNSVKNKKKTTQKKILIKDYNAIIDFISGISPSIAEFMKDHSDYEYQMFSKYVTHSDLISKGKRNEREGYEKNYLYYLTVDDMIDRANKIKDNKNINDFYGNDINANINTTSTAHQSCITLTTDVYDFLGIPNVHKLKRSMGDDAPKQVEINDYAKVYLVNDTMKYFTPEYTKKIFEKLGKNVPWDFDSLKIELSPGADFTPINLTEAAHGLGVQKNEDFQKLRMSIFLNDKFIVLEAKNDNDKYFFIIVDKNPRFYTVLGESNSNWEEYLKNQYIKNIFEAKNVIEVSPKGLKKDRKDQAKWRKLLAEEMMNFVSEGSKIFCPISNIYVDFDTVGTLFRASHIKAFDDCDTYGEAYDINNGILIAANADALFDKHMISIDESGRILYSYLIDEKLKHDLRFDEFIFKNLLTPKRKEYLAEHRRIFEEKEIERKGPNYNFEDELDFDDDDL